MDQYSKGALAFIIRFDFLNIFDASNASNPLPTEQLELKEEDFLVPINKFEFLQSEIQSFVDLKANWDGYNAIPLMAGIGEKAHSLMCMLGDSFIEKISDVFPNPHGTITIEWENRREEKLSLEIGENNYSYFINYSTTPPKYVNAENVLADFKQITEELESLLDDEISWIVPFEGESRSGDIQYAEYQS